MTLTDTSVWIEHFRRGNARLTTLLDGGEVVCHPMVLGEIALGQLARRREVLSLMAALPMAVAASDAEVLHLIDTKGLADSGIGWIDAHLLASAALAGAGVWTLDRPLATAAARLGLAAQ